MLEACLTVLPGAGTPSILLALEALRGRAWPDHEVHQTKFGGLLTYRTSQTLRLKRMLNANSNQKKKVPQNTMA